MSLVCHNTERNEVSCQYSINSNWYFQRPIRTSDWPYFNARCYWTLSQFWITCKTTEIGAILQFTCFKKLQKSLFSVYICLVLRWTWLVLWERLIEMDKNSIKQIINHIHLLKYRYSGSFPSDFVPNLPIDTFAITITQPSYTPGQHWIMIPNFIMNSVSPILLVYPSTITLPENGNTTKWFGQDYKILPVYAVFTQFMQHFICSSFNKRRQLVFMMLMCSLW